MREFTNLYNTLERVAERIKEREKDAAANLTKETQPATAGRLKRSALPKQAKAKAKRKGKA